MDSKLDRRQLLKVAGAAVLGASLGSCARATSPSRHFAKVKVSPRAGDPDYRRLASVQIWNEGALNSAADLRVILLS